jgi:hypothetical protein
VTAVAFVPFFAFRQIYQASFFHRNAMATAEAHVASLVPSGVVVAASGNIGPYLLQRDTVVVYDNDGNTDPYQPWVAGNDGGNPEFGFTWVNLGKSWSSPNQVEAAQFSQLVKRGYVIVWHDKSTGYFLAHAPNVSYASPYGTPVLTGIPGYSSVPGETPGS